MPGTSRSASPELSSREGRQDSRGTASSRPGGGGPSGLSESRSVSGGWDAADPRARAAARRASSPAVPLAAWLPAMHGAVREAVRRSSVSAAGGSGGGGAGAGGLAPGPGAPSPLAAARAAVARSDRRGPSTSPSESARPGSPSQPWTRTSPQPPPPSAATGNSPASPVACISSPVRILPPALQSPSPDSGPDDAGVGPRGGWPGPGTGGSGGYYADAPQPVLRQPGGAAREPAPAAAAGGAEEDEARCGVGAAFAKCGGGFVVTAADCGGELSAGDLVIALEDAPLAGVSATQFHASVRGEPEGRVAASGDCCAFVSGRQARQAGRPPGGRGPRALRAWRGGWGLA